MNSTKRFVRIALLVSIAHAAVAIALAAVVTNRAEREIGEGTLPGHGLYQALGELARVLFYPLLLLHSDVYEPRTTILFVANSLLWGIAVAVACLVWKIARSKRLA